jgi:2-aminobenzoate-CoA ligase
VIGAPDNARGHIVEAHDVLTEEAPANAETTKTLQDHVKATIAPYKYPRSIVFAKSLPKTPTGKIQRFQIEPVGAGH